MAFEFMDPRAKSALEDAFRDFADIGFGIRSNINAGLRGIGDAEIALGKHFFNKAFGPRRIELPAQDPRAISFQPRASGTIRRGSGPFVTGSINSQIKDLKKRVARRRKLKRRAANPARRRGR